jgi:hypothetical protein
MGKILPYTPLLDRWAFHAQGAADPVLARIFGITHIVLSIRALRLRLKGLNTPYRSEELFGQAIPGNGSMYHICAA